MLFCSCVFSSFSIAITSLGEDRANLSAFRTFVRFALVKFCFLFLLVSGKGCGLFFVSKGNLFDVYFTTLQLVLVSSGGGRMSPRTSP